MDTKHTPGPWEVTSISMDTGNIGVGHRDLRILIAEVTNAASFGDMLEGAMKRGGGQLRQEDASTQFANARLIAAAPELLDALKEWAANPDGWSVDQVNRARAIIAKASGPLPPFPNQEQSQWTDEMEVRDLEKPMLVFQYRNWRNEVGERHVIPQKVWWGSTEWHPHGCWLLSAYDLDKQAMRDFDIRGINAPELFGKIEAEAVRALRPAGEASKYHLIFDGFPGPDGPRFIELENDAGHSIGVGEWVDDPRHPGWAQLVLPAYASPIIDAKVAEDDEAYELGKRDGYEQAVQDIDVMTGGDGEYRFCTDHDPERHTPDAATMKQRIADRFEAIATPTNASEGDDRETGWLIELRGQRPTWFQLADGDNWTDDSTKALRFARKVDAEAYIGEVGWTEAFASEHEWLEPRPDSPDTKEQAR